MDNRIVDYLEQRWRAFVEGEGNVPCGDCRGCCRAGYAIGLSDAEAAVLDHQDIEVDGATHHVILPLDNGYCPNLNPDTLECKVYAMRPVSCRQYDCRDMALAAIRLQEDRPLRTNAAIDEVNGSIERHYAAFGGSIGPMAEQAKIFAQAGLSGVAAAQGAVVQGILQLLPADKVADLKARLLNPDEEQREAATAACDKHRGLA